MPGRLANNALQIAQWVRKAGIHESLSKLVNHKYLSCVRETLDVQFHLMVLNDSIPSLAIVSLLLS